MRSLLVAILLLGCSVDDAVDIEHRRPCDQLLEHMLDLSVAGAKTDPKDLAAHLAAMRQAIGPRFLPSCEQSMTTNQIDCAAKASDLSSATACTATASRPQ